jgi:glycosyltransferase involved in cell wall biosynthesis
LEHAVPWVHLPMTRRPSLTDLTTVGTLCRLLPSTDVVYLHSSKAGAVGRMALATIPRRRRPKCVFVPHAWSWYIGGLSAPAYRHFERLASRRADAIVVLSTTEAIDGLDVLPRSAAHKLVLIHNGVDTDTFSSTGPAAERGPGPVVVCVGRLCKQKGQEALIRAMRLLEDRSVRLDLVGSGPDESRLRELAAQLGMSDRVTFVGSTDPRPYYRAADVVVLSSRWEGQSLVLLEAMACGAAVLATPAAASGMGPGAGVLVSGGSDPEQLAVPLGLLLDDADLRGRLAGLARGTVVEHHCAERTVRRHNELVTSLTPRPSAPATFSASTNRPQPTPDRSAGEVGNVRSK